MAVGRHPCYPGHTLGIVRNEVCPCPCLTPSPGPTGALLHSNARGSS